MIAIAKIKRRPNKTKVVCSRIDEKLRATKRPRRTHRSKEGVGREPMVKALEGQGRIIHIERKSGHIENLRLLGRRSSRLDIANGDPPLRRR